LTGSGVSASRVSRLVRRLGTFDVALIVIGSVIGSGIFRTPSVVAQRAPMPAIIVAAWVGGGIVALCGAFVLGELAARRPNECGVYVQLRDAFHPVVGFAYGWAALVALLSGGLAAAAILFSGYFIALTGLTVPADVVATIVLSVLAVLNLFGVREGATTQNVLTLLKLTPLLALIVAALVAHPATLAQSQPLGTALAGPLGALGVFAVAMIPVLFAYTGAQVANFVTEETKDAAQTLPLGLTLGMIGVGLVYVLVNVACLRLLGAAGLARTDVPFAAAMTHVTGPLGTRLTSIAIALSTLGFMSNRMLTVPRLYRAMAADGLFFRSVAWIHPRTHAPVVAIVLQAVVAIGIALSSTYAHIINFVVVIAYGFGGMLGIALFIFRARDRRAGMPAAGGFRAPWHPVSTLVFVLASFGVAVATCIAYPLDGLFGLAVVLSAIPVYLFWSRGGITKGAAA
jgi:APA family basic amino acid/polyamine antiporter